MGKKKDKKAASLARPAVARFDAAQHGRRLAGWVAPSTGPRAAQAGIETLHARAQDALRNDWQARSGQRVWATNLIGWAIQPRPRKGSKTQKEKIRELWDAWCAVADADGVSHFHGLQTLAVKTWLGASGECFIRLWPRRLDDGLPVPLQIQLMEGAMVPRFDHDLDNGHRIRQGIERDRLGRKVAYWCHRQHPGEADSRETVSLHDLSRVPASEMLHLIEPHRPGQLRGESAMSSILTKLRGVGNFDDATLTRQELANLFTFFVTSENPDTPFLDPATGAPLGGPSEGMPLMGLQPGTGQELAPGQSVTFSEPPDAGAGYADFMRTQHLGISAGYGLPYELMTGDIKDVSDRTLRVIINDFRRHCEQRQWQHLIPQMLDPVRKAFAKAARLAGLLSEREAAAAMDTEWHPHAWPYIHPTQDVQAKRIEFEAGFKSRSAIIASLGDDPEKTDSERAEDRRREAAMDLPPAEETRSRVTTPTGPSPTR
jgi:lambda family phage portal protein